MPTGISNGNHNHNRSYREFVQYWEEEAIKEERERVLAELDAESRAVYRELIEVDPEGGEAWYDDDDNVPAYGSTRERIRLVRARIEFLKTQRADNV